MSSCEGQQTKADREGDEADREPQGPVLLNAARGEDPHQQERPDPTKASEQAGERHEMRATNDDWDREHEGEEGSQRAEDRHYGRHATENECRDPEEPSVHARVSKVRAIPA